MTEILRVQKTKNEYVKVGERDRKLNFSELKNHRE